LRGQWQQKQLEAVLRGAENEMALSGSGVLLESFFLFFFCWDLFWSWLRLVGITVGGYYTQGAGNLRLLGDGGGGTCWQELFDVVVVVSVLYVIFPITAVSRWQARDPTRHPSLLFVRT